MSHKRKILQGSASNMARVLLTLLVAMVLPRMLVHRLAPAEYSAWVLILQCSAYVNLLDLGVQTAIAKFVAEYDALGDHTESSRILSNSFAILCISALIGAVIIAVVAWQVPRLFHQMPIILIGDVRRGILTVGLSTVLALPFGAFLAAFTGLQNYGFPTALALTSKLLTSLALITLLSMHGKLIEMTWLIALANVVTALFQYIGWRKYAKGRVGFSWRHMNREIASRLARYGSALSIWTLASLFISGLDMVIVGHYDYKDTGYYGIASTATNFMVLVISSLFSPLLPAVSSLQTERTPGQMGELVIRTTRYCALLLCLMSLLLVTGAYPLLTLWVGHNYAMRSAFFLQVLVLGNAVRLLGLPYSVAVVATGKQHLATISGVAEAAVNMTVSIYLVQRIGAAGVAIGTLIGASISVVVHLAISMKLTLATINLSRRRFLLEGILRASVCAIPSITLFYVWRQFALLPASPPWIAIWTVTTLSLAWLVGLTPQERQDLKETLLRLLYRRYSRVVRQP